MLSGNDISIADLSMTAMRDHAISIKPEQGTRRAPHLYNLHLFDIGTQHIKLNPGGTHKGVIACSAIGYSEDGARGDYNGAIDLHEAVNWHIRDNFIYNLSGDGSGCIVDTQCGSYTSGPAILVWRNSTGTLTERNLMVGSFRNIAYGLGSSHTGGIIRNNIIYRAGQGDAGIELQGAQDLRVENNLVLLADRYRGAIEYRQSKRVTIRANTLSTRPHNRRRNRSVTLENNQLQNVDKTACQEIVAQFRRTSHAQRLPGESVICQ